MSIFTWAKSIWSNNPYKMAEGDTMDAAIKNIFILAKGTPELESIARQYDEGDLAQEVFVAVCLSVLLAELSAYRKDASDSEFQTW